MNTLTELTLKEWMELTILQCSINTIRLLKWIKWQWNKRIRKEIMFKIFKEVIRYSPKLSLRMKMSILMNNNIMHRKSKTHTQFLQATTLFQIMLTTHTQVLNKLIKEEWFLVLRNLRTLIIFSPCLEEQTEITQYHHH